MVLRATGALGRFCRFEFGDDLVDCRCVAFDPMCDRTATERTKTFPISGEIHVRDRNLFPLDVPPDIHLGPVKQRLYAHMFALCSCSYELAPEFRGLILVIPFKLRVAW